MDSEERVLLKEIFELEKTIEELNRQKRSIEFDILATKMDLGSKLEEIDKKLNG